MPTDVRTPLVRLELALRAVGNALSRADLERLRTAEPELAAALEGVARLQPADIDQDARIAIEAARAALVRCKRLGASLLEFTRISLDPAGVAGYSRDGLRPAVNPAALATAGLATTLEARG